MVHGDTGAVLGIPRNVWELNNIMDMLGHLHEWHSGFPELSLVLAFSLILSTQDEFPAHGEALSSQREESPRILHMQHSSFPQHQRASLLCS